MPNAMPESLSALSHVLARVAGPGQYVGGEPNQIAKPDAVCRMALAFPDVYSVGMSHHGLRVLYDIANRMDAIAAERVFAPFPDMEEALRGQGKKLTTLETFTSLDACHVVGFSLSYELAATSVLTILDLGGIPLTRFEREGTAAPIVIAGGAASMNPEPVSDFIDVFLIGESEDALPELLTIVKNNLPLTRENRAAVIREIANSVESAYAPALYATETLADGMVVVKDSGNAPYPVRRRIVADFAAAPQVTSPVVPIHESVHERTVLEIMRGCPNGCRFCQAGYATRPQRERPPALLADAARQCLAATGYDEVGLLSLSTSNYSQFDTLVEMLDAELAPQGVSLSLPSLRVDHALSGIPARFKSVRKSGLTVAPEAGSDRLRAVINKNVKNSDLIAAAEEAFSKGWRQIKLYFMLGLPTETDEDALAIAELSEAAARCRPFQKGKGGGGRPAIHLSVSNFVPKSHTAFQWCGAAHPDVWSARQRLIAQNVNRKRVAYHGHDISTSLLEAAFSRGDRRLGKVILSAWKLGARLDAWTEHFRPGVWNDAFKENGLEPVALATRDVPLDSVLPWSHIDAGLDWKFFRREYEKALEAAPTAMCGPGACAGCGVPHCSFVNA